MKKIYEFRTGEIITFGIDDMCLRADLLDEVSEIGKDYRMKTSPDDICEYKILRDFTITIELNYTEPE